MKTDKNEKKEHAVSSEHTVQGIACLSRKCFFLLYTAFFVLLIGFIILLFLSQGRSFVYHSDAWRQHVRALSYYGKWLRGIVYNLFVNHSLSIETWSFGLGYGGDILTTLQYYCIGEPLTVLSVFVPEKYTKVFFEILMVVRPYLAGLSFYAYTEYILRLRYADRGALFLETKKQGCHSFGQQVKYTIPALTGALCYVFSGTVLYIGMLHPYFVTPMIWFPLLLLGIEKVIWEKKPVVLMVSTLLSGLSNFYFFYILMLLCAVYALLRIVFSFSAWKRRFEKMTQLLVCVLSSMAGAGCTLLPILIQYQNNPRSSTSYALSLFYDADYYKELFVNLVSFINHPQYDTELCLSFVAAAALILLFFLKGHRQLKTAVIAMVLMLGFPVAGYVLNGFSYVINRWTFAAEFLIAFVLVLVWSDILLGKCQWILSGKIKFRNGKKDAQRRSKKVFTSVIVSSCILLLTVCNLVFNLYCAYAKDGFVNEFVKIQSPEEYVEAASANELNAIEQVAKADGAETDFYRYSGKDLTLNASLSEGISSTQFAWSLANGCVSDFFEAIGNLDEQNFAYYALDDRIILQALTGVKYYTFSEWDTSYESQHVLYGYLDRGLISTKEDDTADAESLQEEESRDSWESAATAYHVYENAFALGLGYTYIDVISESAFYDLSMTERQEALLQSAVLSDEAAQEAASAGLETGNAQNIVFYEEKLPFTINCYNGVQVGDGVTFGSFADSEELSGSETVFYVTEAGASVTISFQGLENSETYLALEHLSVEAIPGNDLQEQYIVSFQGYSGDYGMSEKTLDFMTSLNQYYSGWEDFVINLGYSSIAKTSAVITFANPGIYTIGNFEVICQPMVEAMSQIALLNASTLTNVDLSENPVSYAINTITGVITAEKTRFLLLNIPYTTGWTCWVDGEQVSLERANVMFMGCTIDAGEHEIVLKYHTPGLRVGLIISAFGLLLMVGISLLFKNRVRTYA